MSQAKRSIKFEINAQETACALAKQYNLSSNQVLDSLSKAAGYESFGAAKSKLSSLLDKDKEADSSPKMSYGLVRFTVVSGDFEHDHWQVFGSNKGIEQIEQRAISYALNFYDEEQTEQKRRAEFERDGSFYCVGGDMFIKRVIFREITQDQYESALSLKKITH